MMNDIINTMQNRRSIRKFKHEQIKDDELNAVLDAGKYAPSGANQQSALFIVVQNKEMREKITKLNAAVLGKDIDPYYGAPTVILVLADKTKMTPVEDASLALGNMLNAPIPLVLAHAGSTAQSKCSSARKVKHCSRSGAWKVITSALVPVFWVTPIANTPRPPRARTTLS